MSTSSSDKLPTSIVDLSLELLVQVFGDMSTQFLLEGAALGRKWSSPIMATVLQYRKPSLTVEDAELKDNWIALTTADDWNKGDTVTLRAHPSDPGRSLLDVFTGLHFTSALTEKSMGMLNELLKLRKSRFTSVEFAGKSLCRLDNELWGVEPSEDLVNTILTHKSILTELLKDTKITVDLRDLHSNDRMLIEAVDFLVESPKQNPLVVKGTRFPRIYQDFLRPSSAYNSLMRIEITQCGPALVKPSAVSAEPVAMAWILSNRVKNRSQRRRIEIHNLLGGETAKSVYDEYSKSVREEYIISEYCKQNERFAPTFEEVDEADKRRFGEDFDRLISFTGGKDDVEKFSEASKQATGENQV